MDFSSSISFPKAKTGGFLAEKIAMDEASKGPLGELAGLLSSSIPMNFGSTLDYGKALSQQTALNTKNTLAENLADIQERALLTLGEEGKDAFSGWADRGFNESAGGIFTKPYSGASGLAGSRGAGIQGLQQGVSDRVASMMKAARAAGFSVSIGGGWRSFEAQVRLKKQKPRLAATPGRSNHGWGLAADLVYGSAAARRWVHANATRFGLRFPMGYEPWHIEPTRIVKSGTGKTYGGSASAPKSSSTAKKPAAPKPAAKPSKQILM